MLKKSLRYLLLLVGTVVLSVGLACSMLLCLVIMLVSPALVGTAELINQLESWWNRKFEKKTP